MEHVLVNLVEQELRPTRLNQDVNFVCLDSTLLMMVLANDVLLERSRLCLVLSSVSLAVVVSKPMPRRQDASSACLDTSRLLRATATSVH